MSRPRILLLGDYSNFHTTLARGLAGLGCDVHIASDGCGWMNCYRDTDISRRNGRFGGFLHLMQMKALLKGKLAGFDIVALHDPIFTHLRPHRLRPLFDTLKRSNGRIFLSSISTDIPYLDMLAAPDSPLAYSEWFVNGRPSRHMIANADEWRQWHAQELTDYQHYFFDHIDGAVSGLYEYHLAMQRTLGKANCAYGGIPIDTATLPFCGTRNSGEKIKIFLGRDRYRKLIKGSDILELAAKRVVKRNPDKAELKIVENVPFSQFVKLLRDSDIVLDQIYSYTPATTALMAMAYGKTVVTGAEPDYYDFIGEHELQPIVNAPIHTLPLTKVLDELVNHPGNLTTRGEEGRRFVMRHNDYKLVAERFLNFWLSKC